MESWLIGFPPHHPTAISNNRILKLDEGQVNYRYAASDTGKTRYCTVAAEQFIRRFLQHVLPKGFIKVRYYGFFSSGNRHRLQLARKLLNICNSTRSAKFDETKSALSSQDLLCPNCGRVMDMIQTLRPKRYRPP